MMHVTLSPTHPRARAMAIRHTPAPASRTWGSAGASLTRSADSVHFGNGTDSTPLTKEDVQSEWRNYYKEIVIPATQKNPLNELYHCLLDPSCCSSVDLSALQNKCPQLYAALASKNPAQLSPFIHHPLVVLPGASEADEPQRRHAAGQHREAVTYLRTIQQHMDGFSVNGSVAHIEATPSSEDLIPQTKAYLEHVVLGRLLQNGREVARLLTTTDVDKVKPYQLEPITQMAATVRAAMDQVAPFPEGSPMPPAGAEPNLSVLKQEASTLFSKVTSLQDGWSPGSFPMDETMQALNIQESAVLSAQETLSEIATKLTREAVQAMCTEKGTQDVTVGDLKAGFYNKAQEILAQRLQTLSPLYQDVFRTGGFCRLRQLMGDIQPYSSGTPDDTPITPEAAAQAVETGSIGVIQGSAKKWLERNLYDWKRHVSFLADNRSKYGIGGGTFHTLIEADTPGAKAASNIETYYNKFFFPCLRKAFTQVAKTHQDLLTKGNLTEDEGDALKAALLTAFLKNPDPLTRMGWALRIRDDQTTGIPDPIKQQYAKPMTVNLVALKQHCPEMVHALRTDQPNMYVHEDPGIYQPFEDTWFSALAKRINRPETVEDLVKAVKLSEISHAGKYRISNALRYGLGPYSPFYTLNYFSGEIAQTLQQGDQVAFSEHTPPSEVPPPPPPPLEPPPPPPPVTGGTGPSAVSSNSNSSGSSDKKDAKKTFGDGSKNWAKKSAWVCLPLAAAAAIAGFFFPPLWIAAAGIVALPLALGLIGGLVEKGKPKK